MNIPEEAVREAALAIVEVEHGIPWHQEAVHPELFVKADLAARAALSSAAPLLMAQAWSDGEQAGVRFVKIVDEWMKGPKGTPVPDAIPNPYRNPNA